MPNNSEHNLVEIDRESFELIDEVDNIPMADSFVKYNKLEGTTGHGEAKLYVGALQKKNFDDFFNDYSGKGFFTKNDIADYLNDAKFEYEQQEQKYRQDISENWENYYQKMRTLSNREYFNIERAVPQDEARYYIKSDDDIFEYFRNIMLPIISYVSILKLGDSVGNITFLFRPSLSYSYNPYYHPAREREVEREINERQISRQTKEQLVKARLGQGSYRQKLLEESSECIITRVNDERIIVASHTKPWSISNDREKIDHYNGLALTPTYDRLFDQGFISFENDGSIIISPHISPLNLRKLNLTQGRKYVIPSVADRITYLTYHRENIFKR